MSKETAAGHRCMAAFTLAEICNGSTEGRQLCLQQGLHRSCSQLLTQADVMQHSDLKKWVCLCLSKLCEDFLWAKFVCLTETGHPQLYPLLLDCDPQVRAAAVLALGEMFGASSRLFDENSPEYGQVRGQIVQEGAAYQRPQSHASQAWSASQASPYQQQGYGGFPSSESFGGGSSVSESSGGLVFNDKAKQLIEIELMLAVQLLDSCADGSVMVRREAIIALSKFIFQPVHIDTVKVVVSELRKQGKGLGPQTWFLSPAQQHSLTVAVRDHLVDMGFDAAYSHAQFSSPLLIQRLTAGTGYWYNPNVDY